MKNFMNRHYDHYYIQTPDGQSLETTRAICFAPGEPPTAENPYKQRWFYDVEAGYIMRLNRDEKGERLYLTNEAFIKSDERYYEDKYACLYKVAGECNSDCENCQKTRIARTVDLDKPLDGDNDDEESCCLDIAAPDLFAEMERNEEQNELNTRLHKIINSLPDKRKQVCILYFFEGKTAKEIGGLYGVSEAAVLQQISTIKKFIKKLF